MKKHVLFLVLGLSTVAVTMTSCNKPTERPSTMDKAIAGKVMELKELSEITGQSKTVFYSGSEKDLSQLGASLKQVKLSGKVEEVTKKIATASKAAALSEQLKDGVIAIVVLERHIKVLKVVKETTNTNMDEVVSSIQLYDAMKSLSKASQPQAQSALSQKIDELRFKSPSDLGETFGLVELASIKVEKYGVLEDLKTEYGERRSVLGLVQKPFEFATHIILGGEEGAADEGASEEAGE